MRRWALAGRLIGVGWYIGICIAGGVYGGVRLDTEFETDVIFTLVGLFLGLALAFLGTYWMVLPLIKEQQDEDREK